MRFRDLILGAAASMMVSMGLAGPVLAQAAKMNIPGCGPAEGEIFAAELKAREDALAAARETRQALRAELAELTDKYHKADCKPGMAGLCAELKADRDDVEAMIQANNAFVADLFDAVDAYRRQQPFVTPMGQACLRCKSPGDFACENPGLAAGFTPPKMPTMAGVERRRGARASGAPVSGAPVPGAPPSGPHHGSAPLQGNVTANLQPRAQPGAPAAPAQPAAAFNLSGLWTDGQTSHVITHTGNTITLGQPGHILEQGTVNGQEITLGRFVGFPIFDSSGNLTHIGWRGGTAQAWRRCVDPQTCPPLLPATFNLSGLWTDGYNRIAVTHTGNSITTVQQPGDVRGQGTVTGQEIVLGQFIGFPMFDANGKLTHIGWRGGTAQAWRRCLDGQACP